MDGLNGRSAIVTGAASPIGTAIARRLDAEGARLMLGDLDGDRVSSLAAELEAQHVVGDLSEEARVRDMVARTVDAYGSVDILVNNAGGGVIRPFLEHDAESLNATLNRNLWTTLWACHAALPHMVEKGFGRIVNIGADSVRNGLWDHAGYNAAKGGVSSPRAVLPSTPSRHAWSPHRWSRRPRGRAIHSSRSSPMSSPSAGRPNARR
jgi:2,3-dihydroxy-2,3-dihydro-p-cumate dehydrogenase